MKKLAASKAEKLTVREARTLQATREYEEDRFFLEDRVDELKVIITLSSAATAVFTNLNGFQVRKRSLAVPNMSAVAVAAQKGTPIDLRREMKQAQRPPTNKEVETALTGGNPMIMDVLLQVDVAIVYIFLFCVFKQLLSTSRVAQT
jgi:hypothetical protein